MRIVVDCRYVRIGHHDGISRFTAGIVSGLGEIPIRGTNRTAQYLRSDVQLGPGNSGGPLLNAQGAVVGINAMVDGGLALAVPVHLVEALVDGLTGPARPVLGVEVRDVVLPAPLTEAARAFATAAPTTAPMTAKTTQKPSSSNRPVSGDASHDSHRHSRVDRREP